MAMAMMDNSIQKNIILNDNTARRRWHVNESMYAARVLGPARHWQAHSTKNNNNHNTIHNVTATK